MSEEIAHYCIVREDLSKGIAMAQLLHAAGESSPGNLPEGTIAVALGARDEESLLNIEKKLIRYDVPHVAVREPDAPWNGALMAIGVNPGPKSQFKKFFSNLPLIR